VVPYVVAIEREWQWALLFINIALDCIYASGIFITEGRQMGMFLLALWGRAFLKRLNRVVYVVCCFGWVSECRVTVIPQYRRWRTRRQLNRKAKKVRRGALERQKSDMMQGVGPQDGAADDSGSAASGTTNATSPAVVSMPKPVGLSQEFKEEFAVAWDTYMRKFFKNYLLTHKFVADIFLLLPVDWFFVGAPWMRLAKFAASVFRFSSQYEFVLTTLRFRTSTVQVLRLMLVLALLFHVFACSFFFVSDVRGERWASGMIPPEPVKLPMLRQVFMSRTENFKYGPQRFKQYSACLLYAMMYIVGYQDISVPQNVFQAFFAVAYALAGSMIFATMVGTVSALMQTRDVTASMYHEKLENVKGFMRERKVSPWLRKSVKRYYEILRNTRRDISAQEIFHDLDSDLFRRISHNLHHDLVMNVDLFRESGNDFFIGDICQSLEYVLVLDGISIIHEGDVGQRMFFVHSGQIEMYGTDANGKEIVYQTFGPGHLFGDIALVSVNQKRIVSYRAKSSIVELFSLSFGLFYAILEKYPDCKPKIYELLKERKTRFDMVVAGLMDDSNHHRRSSRGFMGSLLGKSTFDTSQKKPLKNSKSQRELLHAEQMQRALHQSTRPRSRSLGMVRNPPSYRARAQVVPSSFARGPPLTIEIPQSNSSRRTKAPTSEISHTGFTPLLGNVRREEIDFPTPSPPSATNTADSTDGAQNFSSDNTQPIVQQDASSQSPRANTHVPLLERRARTTSEVLSPMFSPTIATILPDPEERIADLRRIMGMGSQQTRSPQSMTQKRKVRRVMPVDRSAEVSRASMTSAGRSTFDQGDSDVPVTTVSLRRDRPYSSGSISPSSPSSPSMRRPKDKKKRKKRMLPPVSGTSTRHTPISPLGGLPPLSSPSRSAGSLSPLSRSLSFSPLPPSPNLGARATEQDDSPSDEQQ